MIALLPVFALLLKALYLGGRQRYPQRPRQYAEHLVFAAHDLSFLFLAAIIAVTLPASWLRTAIALWVVAYGLWATKAVYGGRWLGVLARAWVLGISYLVMFTFVTIGLLVAAAAIR